MKNLVNEDIIDAVISVVRASSKYRMVAPDLIDYVARTESPKERSRSAAIKRVKRRLHQMIGAYIDTKMPYDRWLSEIRNSVGTPALTDTLMNVLKSHASTRERLTTCPDFYARIFSGLPPPTTIVDLACGVGPLARPFWAVPADTLLVASDVVEDMMSFVVDAVRTLGFKIEGGLWNLLEGPPSQRADIALLLKTIPCLRNAATARQLIAGIDAQTIIVSFPTRSLGGREKGMTEFYSNSFREMTTDLPFRTDVMELGHELVFRLHRH